MRADHHHPVTAAEQSPGHLGMILVGQHAKQKHDRPTGKYIIQRLPQSTDAVRIVRPVQNQQRRSGKNFEPPRPDRFRQTLPDHRRRQPSVALRQQLAGPDRQRRIFGLVAAQQTDGIRFRRRLPDPQFKNLPCLLNSAAGHRELPAQHFTNRPVPARRRLDHRQRRAGSPGHDGYAGFYDPGLVMGDSFDRIAAAVSVLQRHVGDHRQLRQNDVRGVEQAAEAHFHHHDLRLFPGEPQKRRCRQHFEFRRAFQPVGDHRVGRRLGLFDHSGESRPGDIRPAELQPFRVVDQVRRSVHAGSNAGFVQNGGNHGRRATLAVGAGHMDRTEATFRMAESFQQRFDPHQSELDAEFAERLEIGQRLFISHRRSLLRHGW